MRVSLLIPTRERPDALAAVLRGIGRQTRVPDEIVIGDDGSGAETARVIREAAAAGLNIRHRWEEYRGFRAGRMRNVCFADSTGDYVIMIDDDMLPHPEFIADHLAAARPGFFVQGCRVLLGETASQTAIAAMAWWPSLFTPGVGNRKNLIRNTLLSRLFSRVNTTLRGTRTCNFALWREDFASVNGFNEDFVGWGREDSEFVTRLFRTGLKRRVLRFAALACHLYHPPRPRDDVSRNDALLQQTLERGDVRCKNGLNLHQRK